jgi:hypothetical protein
MEKVSTPSIFKRGEALSFLRLPEKRPHYAGTWKESYGRKRTWPCIVSDIRPN